jgi:hypothetical protein
VTKQQRLLALFDDAEEFPNVRAAIRVELDTIEQAKKDLLPNHLRELHLEIEGFEQKASIQTTYSDYGCAFCRDILAEQGGETDG